MTASRPSLAQRLAAVAGPQVSITAAIEREAPPEARVQAPKVVKSALRPVKVSEAEPVASSPSTTTPARVGKVMVAGYFSPQMAKSVKLLAVERDTTVQALIGEGLDAILHKYGKHPMGER